jgi:hypothetical protein
VKEENTSTPVIFTGFFLSGASIIAEGLGARGYHMVAGRNAARENDLAGNGADADQNQPNI